MPRLTLAALALAGLTGLVACGRQETTPENDEPAEEAPAEEGNGEATGGDEETITVEAGDLWYEGIPETLPAGTLEIEFENVGDMPHDIVIEELDDREVVTADAGQSDTGTVELEPGEYTFYCSVPGHRAQMEQTVTVE